MIKIKNMNLYQHHVIKAFYDIEFNECILIKNCRITENNSKEGNHFIKANLPSKEGKDGNYYTTVMINSKDLYKEFVLLSLKEYKQLLSELPKSPIEPI